MFHYKNFEKWINNLSSESLEALNKIITEKVFDKNDFLLRPNRDAKQVFFILEGSTRNFLIKNEKEVTLQFNFKGEITFPLNIVFENTPSDEYIQALTPTRIYQLNYRNFQGLQQQKEVFYELERNVNDYYFYQITHRLRGFQSMTAKERYIELLKREPHLLQQVSLTQIASYLGIQLASLSRLRASITTKN